MKKCVFVLLLTVGVLITGCGNKEENITKEIFQEETSVEENMPVEEEISEEESEENGINDYMDSVKEQSESIRNYLEHEAMTQSDMNGKAQELYELWDNALNYLWGEIKSSLSEEEFSVLLEEQRSWIAEKEREVENAGKEVEGGSLYPLVTYEKAAEITEKRVYELYELLE